jgi:hypothetical protein
MHAVGGGRVHAVGTVYSEGKDVVGTVHVIGDGHVGTSLLSASLPLEESDSEGFVSEGGTQCVWGGRGGGGQ